MAKETLMLNSLLVMMTGMTLEEAVKISIEQGNDAMTQALMEGAAKKRGENDLMSPENMMGKPKEKDDNGKA